MVSAVHGNAHLPVGALMKVLALYCMSPPWCHMPLPCQLSGCNVIAGKRGAAASTAEASTTAGADTEAAGSGVTNEPGNAWLPSAAASRADVDAFVRKASAAWLDGEAAEVAEGSNNGGQQQRAAAEDSSSTLPPLSVEAVNMVLGRHAQWVQQHPALAKRVQGFLAQARIKARRNS